MIYKAPTSIKNHGAWVSTASL